MTRGPRATGFNSIKLGKLRPGLGMRGTLSMDSGRVQGSSSPSFLFYIFYICVYYSLYFITWILPYTCIPPVYNSYGIEFLVIAYTLFIDGRPVCTCSFFFRANIARSCGFKGIPKFWSIAFCLSSCLSLHIWAGQP